MSTVTEEVYGYFAAQFVEYGEKLSVKIAYMYRLF